LKAFEANFDGLVGPTHNYAGLSMGNVASLKNAGGISRPKEAAKQGLAKAWSLAQLGLVQGVIPPHQRPDLTTLRRIGFSGSDKDIIEKAFKRAPEILAGCYSCSPMWTANAATVSPSADTADGKIHFTPANLNNKFHRSIEPAMTGEILRRIFKDEQFFVHHKHLPEGNHFGDEGAANHTRFCENYDDQGVEFFVFGRHGFSSNQPAPVKFPARQTLEASQAVARLHGLKEELVVFAQQDPDTIDAGVFHNDVISVGNQNVYFYHEKTLCDQTRITRLLKEKIPSMQLIEVPNNRVSVQDAVESYLFNSQLVTLKDEHMAIIVPKECEENPRVKTYLDDLVTMGSAIKEYKVYDVKQSMKNGGGPACLRLRVAMTPEELQGVNTKALLDQQQFEILNKWVDKHYRDEISPQDLRDPNLMLECQTALDELTQILDLGAIYPFQV
jgi:succinylarginine dihydrolase